MSNHANTYVGRHRKPAPPSRLRRILWGQEPTKEENRDDQRPG